MANGIRKLWSKVILLLFLWGLPIPLALMFIYLVVESLKQELDSTHNCYILVLKRVCSVEIKR